MTGAASRTDHLDRVIARIVGARVPQPTSRRAFFGVSAAAAAFAAPA